MNSSTKLSIVFLNFNKLEETKTTSKTLQALCKNRDDIEIIAVDNGSSDGTAEFLQAQPNIISILLPDNNGIAGYSVGFKQSKGQYILVLDDDSSPTDLIELDKTLENFSKNPTLGVIATNIHTPEGLPQWSWHLPKTNTFSPSPFFIGCGFIIRRDLFERIGWYPADFFLYQNEIDVSFQVRLQGYEIFYDPKCIIVHRGKPSQRPGWRRVFFPTRNTLWLIRRYYPATQTSYLIFSRLLIGLIRAIMFGEIKAYLNGARDGLTHSVPKQTIPIELRHHFTPFFKQNSIIHQLFKLT